MIKVCTLCDLRAVSQEYIYLFIVMILNFISRWLWNVNKSVYLNQLRWGITLVFGAYYLHYFKYNVTTPSEWEYQYSNIR